MIDPMASSKADLWGLVLAGGEGKRLEDYVQQLRGEYLPKQYVNFIGTRRSGWRIPSALSSAVPTRQRSRRTLRGAIHRSYICRLPTPNLNKP